MPIHNPFNCFLIGEGTLLIQCAEILLSQGHEICGLISADAPTQRWADGKNIPHSEPTADFRALLSQQPFDYLFSIVNEHILPREVLELLRRLAINYHDAPLPRYAGTHATSWALLQRETTHGVTWHVMSTQVDAGEILKQCPVAIAEGETALTLNAKCYEAALRSFAELIGELSCGQTLARPQDLDKRTFFPRYQRPPAEGILSWTWAAEDMDALIRALHFGPYPNRLGLPKLAIGQDFVIVPQIEALDSITETPPGTVTGIDGDSLKVSTPSREIVLRKIQTIDGQPLSIPEIVAMFGLYEGYRFKDLEPARARHITELNASIYKHEAFWVKRLETLHPIELPYAARNRSQVKPAQYASVTIPLPEEVTGLLESWQGRWGQGEFLCTAVAAYLARIGGVHRFEIGFRDVELQRDLVGLEGLFAAEVPLCIEVDITQSFTETLPAIREQVQLTRKHRTYARDVVARYPALRSTPELPRKYSLPVVVEQGEGLHDDKVTVNADFTVIIPEDGASYQWLYNVEVFHTDSVTRMLSQFTAFLRGIAADPDRPLADLPLLTEAERQQLLVEWNATAADYPKAQCLHQLFEAQVERTPDAVAVVFVDQQLTYRELNTRANQLAHYLQALGVGPEVLVGLCLERSLEMVVGLLGILKAGGAYVPLDPAYPQERLAFMLEDAHVPVLVTQQRLVAMLPTADVELVALDTAWVRISQESTANPSPGATPENLAYVLYTSGSTGKPKGVAMSHRPLSNLIRWQLLSSALPVGAKTLQFTSLSFDVSFQELFSTWCAGGALVLIPEEIRQDAAGLWRVLAAKEVARLFVPFVMLQQLAQAGEEEGLVPPRLREIITAGEQLRVTSHIAGCFEKLKDCVLQNQYGPSESHVVTAYRLGGSVRDWPALPPIGRPIANIHLYILDRHLHPLPPGVPGELYIGGEGLARGYLNQPQLTAEKFIPDPFSSEPGARLYRTGDLARYQPDGNIEFLGRTDHQVKIRGFRIEPGEIEAVLGHHPAVQQAVVMAREEGAGDKRLVAYIVPKQEPAPTSSALHSFLKSKLPEYMVPSAFVVLDALPLTPSGKLDRRALPAPEGVRPELTGAFVAPRTPVEEVLAGIWVQVLRLEQVGIHDNFFELGGHSLLATQVIARVRKAFQVELPLHLLFEKPTVFGLAVSIEEARQSHTSVEVPPLVPVLPHNEVSLSFAQQRLWFLNQWEPQSPLYTIPYAVRLSGPLDRAALEQSVHELVRRHEALRTTFTVVHGRPVQVIAPAVTVALAVVDVQAWPAPEREARAQQVVREEARCPFELAQGPLLRATLLGLSAEEHVLLLTLHHIVADGWSMGVLCRELSALYAAFCAGQPSPLPELPIQYADFAVWQRQWLQGEMLTGQLGYWQGQLAGLPVLALPTDRPRPAVQSFRGASQTIELSKELTEGLKALSRQQGVTLFMTLLAAFQTLLHRYSGQDDIVVGSPIAGRTRVETEGLIGFFVNTLVLRTDLSDNPPFRELLGRVHEVCLGAYTHQDLPFEKLVEELQRERDPSRHPLFQALFALQNTPAAALRLAGLMVTPLEVDRGTATFDLAFLLVEEANSLKGSVEYNTDLFEAGTISRMLGHFQTLLAGIVANPEQRLSDLPLLTAAERHQLLAEWNATATHDHRDKCIHQLFEAQVECTPDAVAVVCEDEQLTYRELNARANQLAHYLRKCGVGPESLVGLCVERSLEMLVGLLGILKAGGAYVPLDPGYPQERLALMLADSQVRLVVTQEKLRFRLPPHDTHIVYLEPFNELAEIEASQTHINPVTDTTPDNLAYVIYTSGSTGRPKGVLISHAQVTRLFAATEAWFHFDRHDVWTLFHSSAFDFSVWEIWGALLYGGRLVVVPYWVSRSPERFYKLLGKEKVTALNQTPSAFLQLMQAEQSMDNPPELALRLIIFGGEALDFPSLKSWCERHGDHQPRLVNMYGITETTVHVTYRPITATDLSAGEGSFIGVPIPDLELYVLDQHHNPVPLGVPGELYVGGAGVGRGYLNRPALTAERFIPHMFCPGVGKRLYRSGDLVRYRANRDIEYLGRLDAQVKIRGFRIELGEIESVLRQHPAVREAIVIARKDAAAEKRLVAYVVPAQQVPTVSELNTFLRQKLPEYMLPSAFMFLDTLPLTVNGKVDRLNLPAPDQSRPKLENALILPRTPVEELIAEIWAGVLKLERVGIHDNFFELGGHSLLFTQVASRIHQAFHVHLPLRILFEAPTIADLSTAIAAAQIEQADSAEVARMVGELSRLSPEEVKALLEAESRLSVPPDD